MKSRVRGVRDQAAAADHDQLVSGQGHLGHQVAGHEHRPALPARA